MTPDLLKQFKAARRVSVPIVAITTPDPAATIRAIGEELGDKVPVLQWDVVSGILPVNAAGKTVREKVVGELDETIANPVALAAKVRELPPKSAMFMHLAGRLIGDPMTIQAVWNLRDVLKQDGRTLVLLAIDGRWPAELAGDIVPLDEPLPDAHAIEQIINRQYTNAMQTEGGDKLKALTAGDMQATVEAVQGLSAFQIEQTTAMSLRATGYDRAALWERKRKQIEQTPGLKVFRDRATFADIGGVSVVKDFLKRVMHGQARPNAVVFVDEIEKFLAGSSGGGDNTGVSQDQLGQLLSYMQDQNAVGMIFVGPPGAAKSAVAKAAGNEAGIPTIQLDLGAMKGGIVGTSEQNLRSALKVITSVSNGRSLWIATCNSISDLPPELRRRFTLGTFFFDLPDEDERHAIWKIWQQKYEIHKNGQFSGLDSEGWTGAEIRQCCDIAWRLGCTLKDAAAYVVPVSVSAKDQLDKLRRAADGRFLSASRPGVYRRDDQSQTTNGQRMLALEEA